MKADFQRRVDFVKDRVPIDIVIMTCGGDIQDSYGDWQKTLCPFHADTVASAATNVIAGAFVCHACGVKGDVIDIAKLHLKLMDQPHSFTDALTWLEGMLYDDLPE